MSDYKKLWPNLKLEKEEKHRDEFYPDWAWVSAKGVTVDKLDSVSSNCGVLGAEEIKHDQQFVEYVMKALGIE